MKRIQRFTLFLGLMWLATSAAWAHRPSLSSLYLEAEGNQVDFTLHWDLPKPTSAPVAPSEVEGARKLIEKLAPHWIALGVGRDAQPLPFTLPAGTFLYQEGDSECQWKTSIPVPPQGTWHLQFEKLAEVTKDHREYVKAMRDGKLVTEVLVTTKENAVKIDWDPAGTAAAAAPADESSPNGSLFQRFFVMGINHILTGIDHLLYVASLVLGCRRFKQLLAVITSFTIAHSITLALTTLNIVSPPAVIIEPAIAASIVFVAVENVIRHGREPFHRAFIAFFFGLVHGFGFADILKELHLHGSGLAVSLASFNLGVEGGQLVVLIPLVPFVMICRKQAWYNQYGEAVLSAIIAAVGTLFLFQRIQVNL